MLLLAYRGIVSKDGDKRRYMLSVFMMFLFCEYGFWAGDYYYYAEEFKEARLGGRANLEPFYYWIASKFSSYDSIRFVIWGTALAQLLLLFKIIDRKSDSLIYMYVSTYFIWFTYARASLAMITTLLGLILLTHENKKMLILQIIGLFLLLISSSLHKSATFGILMAFMAIATYRLGKSMHIALLISLSFVLYFYREIIDINFFAEIQEERLQNTMNAAQLYLEGEQRVYGIGELFEKVAFHISLYMISILYIVSVIEEKSKTFPKYVRILGCYAFWTALISSLFLLNWGYNTLELYERFSMFALIPSSVFLCHIYNSSYKRRFTKTTIIIAVFSTVYTLMYSYYCSLVDL